MWRGMQLVIILNPSILMFQMVFLMMSWVLSFHIRLGIPLSWKRSWREFFSSEIYWTKELQEVRSNSEIVLQEVPRKQLVSWFNFQPLPISSQDRQHGKEKSVEALFQFHFQIIIWHHFSPYRKVGKKKKWGFLFDKEQSVRF